jgi:hypothetical protein
MGGGDAELCMPMLIQGAVGEASNLRCLFPLEKKSLKRYAVNAIIVRRVNVNVVFTQ